MKKLSQFSLENGDLIVITVNDSKVTLKINDKDYGTIIDDDNIKNEAELYACITFSRFGKAEADKIRVIPQYTN